MGISVEKENIKQGEMLLDRVILEGYIEKGVFG